MAGNKRLIWARIIESLPECRCSDTSTNDAEIVSVKERPEGCEHPNQELVRNSQHNWPHGWNVVIVYLVDARSKHHHGEEVDADEYWEDVDALQRGPD